MSKSGIKINRIYTKEGVDVFDQFKYKLVDSVIKKPSGEEVFRMPFVEVPENWSQVSVDILAQKYFRKAGIVPELHGPDYSMYLSEAQEYVKSCTHEISIKQVVRRMANCWTSWGIKYNYFENSESAFIFRDECIFMLMSQIFAPNSPQWFNTGLFDSYNINSQSQGHYYVDENTGEMKKSESAYERPQVHACFILSVKDDLVNEGGIMDLWTREARIFKYGSGVGTNFSNIRGEGEKLSGGGTSSGVMSFLKIGDSAAGAIKSGGTTRRAAKMVILDADHPEIEEFIEWKSGEEDKVKAMIDAGYSSDYEGIAYKTVSGQNSNNSVRVTNDFMDAVKVGASYDLINRTDGSVNKKVNASKIFGKICEAAHKSADPGIQYHDTINKWHTCKDSGEIRGSNPCSEYMFLDDTACNLASINLAKFLDEDKDEIMNAFDYERFCSASELVTLVLEISVAMAQYPSKEVAQKSYEYRTLGIGFANLGASLMKYGIPYDSEKGRDFAGMVASLMTGSGYYMSAKIADSLGAFKGYYYGNNQRHISDVVEMHGMYADDLDIKYSNIISAHSSLVWEEALEKGLMNGYRNAQISVIAPTGTIGLLMDCDTTGIEPDFSLVKYKKLSGGGYFKIVNQSVAPALKRLGYKDADIEYLIDWIKGTNYFGEKSSISSYKSNSKILSPNLNNEIYVKNYEKISLEINNMLENNKIFSLNQVYGEIEKDGIVIFNEWQENEENKILFNELGFSKEEIAFTDKIIFGRGDMESCPLIKKEHLKIFDCANRSENGERFLSPMSHVEMMAAVQPFISGAISKTVNLPNESTDKDIYDIYMNGWEMGLKAIAVYRDGSKHCQPLNTSSSESEKEESDLMDTGEIEISPLFNSIDAEFKYQKRSLPRRRRGFTQKLNVSGHEIYLRTGEYENGDLGEIFIDMHKEGSTLKSTLNGFAIAVSMGLQSGIPLEKFVDKFCFTRFEPNGMVDHPNLKSCTSIFDCIFRILGYEYLGMEELVHVKNVEVFNDSCEKTENSTNIAIKNIPSNNSININNNQDAPPCNVCGFLTIRNGTCYRCLNCGNSMGCS